MFQTDRRLRSECAALAQECIEERPNRLYTDKHGMDSLCDSDAVQCVSPVSS